MDKGEKIMNIFEGLGCLVIPVFIGLVLWFASESDSEAEDVFENTSTFMVTDKDFVDLSKNVITESYSWVVYIDRYDKNGKEIKCSPALRRVPVSLSEYDKVFVDSTYKKGFIKIMTYGN